MSRRQSSSNAAIDLGIARSTDFGAPPTSSRVSPKWRAPRPVTWPPPLPPHRVPGSAPRSAPPNRFHEPVLHAPLVAPYVEPRRPRVGLWVAFIALIAAASTGFVLRDRLSPGAAAARTWVRSQVPSDLTERPRVAWTRIRELAALEASRARSLVPSFGSRETRATGREGSPATGNDVPVQPAGERPRAAIPEAPVVDVSALPVAAPLSNARSAPRYKPAAPREVAPPAVTDGAPTTSPQAPTTAVTHSAPPPAAPASEAPAPAELAAPVRAAATPTAPAPEPGSLDDLIRKTVERESHLRH